MEHADDDLRGMAFHEAGHAVVAWSLNLRVESIYIREIGAGNSATKTDPPDRLPFMDQLATLAAGLEAGLQVQPLDSNQRRQMAV